MECLGTYGKVTSTRGFLDRDSLLTRDELAGYIESARGCRGVKNARRALGLALFPARSPLETKTAIILTLPTKMGGYGLPRPELNSLICFRPEELKLCQAPRYEVDLCWEKQRTIVEVDSYQYHVGTEKLDADAMKRNTLKSLGWKVNSVTSGQLSGDALDVLARQLARDLGVKGKQPPARMRDWLIEELA
ncbi:DUF559 domain-containing protein [Thermophilibacter provencensis]|uniref:DUF559 domain-containing protein n=1 Tax=Thermophilibacter provencensis TaxID=1852386 RepID=A0ABT7V5I7_9ACTN|nr:DUF559 domain-containing protein [Thermophilibacter provencensis]MDM8271862.1 DUF559 domain-containing protein [Thermophilibacter provencensis]